MIYWFNKNDNHKQIFVSDYPFSSKNVVEILLDEFCSTNCPIKLEEFYNYEGIPSEIIINGIQEIREYLRKKCEKRTGYIGFTGLS